MFKNNKATVATLSLSLVTTIFGTSAVAEQEIILEEIKVTAQRRSESVLDVPIAVNTYGADQLRVANATRTEDLAMLVPSLQMVNSIGSAIAFMRGIGSLSAQPGAESGIAFYVDEVYYSESVGVATTLGSVERVEVLKGPQGTLYGRNATGGLIHIITQEPQLDPQGKVRIGYENYDAIVGSIYSTAGLSEQLKASIDINFRDQGEGFGKNLTTGKEVNFVENWKVATKVLWEPTDADKITIAADYYKDTSDKGFVTSLAPGNNIGLGGNVAPRDPQDTWSNETADYENEAWGGSIKWAHEFNDDMLFKSITAYREVNNSFTGFDGDADWIDLTGTMGDKEHWSFQQEFLLQGSVDQLDYTAGLFYFTNETTLDLLTDFATPFGVLLLGNVPTGETTSYSVFGQVDYKLTERDTITAGLRYTLDEQKMDATNFLNGFAIDSNKQDVDFDKVTWRLALKHEFNNDLMAYASISRGFRSGVFNTLAQNLADPPVNPEVIDAYEAGFKGSFFEKHLELGLNVFFYDYDDLQVTSFKETVVPILQNAAKSEIYGLELEAQATLPVPVGNLLLFANASVLHDEYKEFEGCTVTTSNYPFPGTTEGVGDCSGNHLAWTPRFDLSFGGYYTIPVNEGELGLGLNYYHSDGYYFDAANVREQPSYDLVNAEIAYTFPDKRTSIRLYGSNLTDEEVRDFLFSSGIGIYGFVRPPRTYGIELNYAWGQ